MSDADLTALVVMLRQIQCEPASFDTYSMASAAERAADAIERLRSPGGASAEPEKGSKAWQEIQGLRGSNARHRIEMDIIERLLAGETDEPMMEYWTDVHDRIQALVRRASGEPTETLYTAKDVEALFAIRDAAVAAHAAKPVATAWMRDGVIENAFPRPPRSAEEWAKYDADGYWKAKGYSEAPLYSAPPSPPEPSERQPDGYAYRYPDGYIRFSGGREVNGSDPVETIPYYFRRAPEPRDEPLPPCSTCGGETVPFCTSCGYTTTKPAEYPAYTECQHDHMKPNPTLRATYPKHGSQSGWVQEYRCNVCQCSFERPIATAGLRANGETP